MSTQELFSLDELFYMQQGIGLLLKSNLVIGDTKESLNGLWDKLNNLIEL